MCPCEPENAAPLGAVNPNLRPFQNRTPPFGSRKYQMPIVSRKPKRGIGKGRNIEGITFTGRAGTLSESERSVRRKGLALLPRYFYAPPRSPWASEPRNFPRTIITFNGEVHSALGMKPEPPFKTADEKFSCEHDAEVTACQALLDTTALPIPKRIPPQPTKGGCCVLPCLYAHM